MKLRHLHLPGITSYLKAGQIQDKLVAEFLSHKANPTQIARPEPAIITAQFSPVYTCGRREVGTVSQSQQDFLKADDKAEFHEALRGGQTTFHGPGQLIAYPIIDLRRHDLTPRTYVCHIEKAVIRTCARYGIKTMTTENPGVWVNPDSKIAAVGIHLRRNITSHGIGLNVNTDLSFFGRIVACGLEGKSTTSFEHQGVTGHSVDQVGQTLVQEFIADLHGAHGIEIMPSTPS